MTYLIFLYILSPRYIITIMNGKNIILYNINEPEIKCLANKYQIYDCDYDQSKKYNNHIILVCVCFSIDTRNDLMIAGYNETKLIEISKKIVSDDMKLILRQKNAKLLLFDGWEIMNLDICHNLNYFLTQILKLSPDKIIISYCDIFSNYKSNFKIISYDWPYLRHKLNFNENDVTTIGSKKSRHLVMLNRRINMERFITCMHIYSRYKNKSYISYIQNVIPTQIDAINFCKSCNVKMMQNEYEKFIKDLPLTLDSNDFFKVEWFNTKNIKNILDDSYIMLTFETNCYNDTRLQVSEKTYKAIYSGMPFILFACSSGILNHLKKLGFKTFSPLINEDYDNAMPYQKRFNLLIKEIDRIMCLSLEKMHELYLQCVPIINHNLEILKKIDNIPDLITGDDKLLNL